MFTKRFSKANLLMVGLLIFLASCGQDNGPVQWRGPERTGYYPDKELLSQWPDSGPPLIMKLSGIGKGHSTPLFYKDKIYVTGRKDTLEYLSAFNEKAELQWQVPYGKAWYKSFPDSRCTPAIEKNKIYLITGSGEVVCHDARNGDQIWYVNADDTYDGNIWQYGVSESPLLTDDAVIYTTGGKENSLIALDKENGSLIWKAQSIGGARGYASHIQVEYAGIPIIIAQTARDVMGVDARNGDLLWHYNLIDYHEIAMGKGNNINTPVYQDGKFYITSGYNHPGMLFEIGDDGHSVNLLWTNNELDCHLGGVILKDGFLYQSNWQNNSQGRWICADWSTGDIQWEKDWYNKGSIISADGLLYLYEEKWGHVGLLKPNSKHFDLISEFQIKEGAGPHWAHPSIYNGYLYLRHGDIIVVYDVNDH